jgi:hypothetical protein
MPAFAGMTVAQEERGMDQQDLLILGAFIMEAVFWLGAYFLIIRTGFRSHIHAMPVVAMCGNIAWEYILGLGLFPACPVYWEGCPNQIMGPLTLAAALMDTVILYIIIRYGRNHFKTPFLVKYFPYLVILGVLVAFAIIYSIMGEMYTQNIYDASVNGATPDFLVVGLQGGLYTGWGLALMMGLLFITMLISRDGVEGQSFYIALFMLLGNVGAFLFDIFATNQLLTLLYVLVVSSLTVNFIYAVLVYRKSKELGLNPLRRF